MIAEDLREIDCALGALQANGGRMNPMYMRMGTSPLSQYRATEATRAMGSQSLAHRITQRTRHLPPRLNL
jgi:hypothetical protein